MLRRVLMVSVLAVVLILAVLTVRTTLRDAEEEEDAHAVYHEAADVHIPGVSFWFLGREMNELRGYTDDEREYTGRTDLTILPEDRQLAVLIEPEGEVITGLRYEIRDLSGERLVERTEVSELSDDGGRLRAILPIQNLIQKDEEYNMTLMLSANDGKEYSYYTRILLPSSPYTEEMLALAEEFSEKTFNQQQARDLTTYLEVDANEDNSTLGYVTLKNNFDMLTWHATGMQMVGEASMHLRELRGDTGVVVRTYTTRCETERGECFFDVKESFTMRRGAERIFMMDFTRRTNQIFSGDPSMFTDTRIMLGITDGEGLQSVEEESGRMKAFVTAGEVWLHDTESGITTEVYTARESDDDPGRLAGAEKARILAVSETGEMYFLVSGYLCRGPHTGTTGVCLYRYDNTENVLTELLYLPSKEDACRLQEDVDTFCYLAGGETLYLLMNHTVYGVSLTDHSVEVVASGLTEENFAASGDRSRIAWMDSDEPWYSEGIRVLDLESGEQTGVTAEGNSVVKLVGFVGSDLVYGLGHPEEPLKRHGRVMGLPLYAVEVVNEAMEQETRYEKPDICLMDVSIADSRIHMERMRKTESGYVPETEDTLISNMEQENAAMAGIGYLADRVMGRVYFLQTSTTEQQSRARIPGRMEAREDSAVVLEGGGTHGTEAWISYVRGDYNGLYTDFADAVRRTWDGMGVVTDEHGNVIWSRVDRAQEARVGDNGTAHALAERYLAEYRENRQTAEDGTLLLDCGGLSLSQVLYFISEGMPVCAFTDDDHYLLIPGYDRFSNVMVVHNPGTEEMFEELLGINDSNAFFDALGNDFVCFLKQ